MKTVGLVLSGGGARGFAHLGVIKALNEFGIKPDIISGASAGAMMGAFIAAGRTPDEVLEIAKKASFFNLSHLLFRKAGLFDMKAFEEIYLEHFPHNSFDKLPIPLNVATTDIVNCKSVYFSRGGNLAKAIMASSSIPMLFEPVELDGYMLLDGGILNNFPVEPLIGKCDKIIGVHVNSISTQVEHLHMKDMLDRSFHLSLSASVKVKEPLCDLFIEPPSMSRFGVLDIETADEIFEWGYRYTLGLQQQIDELKKQLNER